MGKCNKYNPNLPYSTVQQNILFQEDLFKKMSQDCVACKDKCTASADGVIDGLDQDCFDCITENSETPACSDVLACTKCMANSGEQGLGKQMEACSKSDGLSALGLGLIIGGVALLIIVIGLFVWRSKRSESSAPINDAPKYSQAYNTASGSNTLASLLQSY
jgi:hypothetical protein